MFHFAIFLKVLDMNSFSCFFLFIMQRRLKMCTVLLFIILLAQSFVYSDNVETVFTQIYNEGKWGKNANGHGCSGSGSSLENTVTYRAYLQYFLKKYNIRSVIDVGCGDWTSSSAINWGSIRYIGYDVVKSVIENNREQYGTPLISFVHDNGIKSNLPKADLLICKEVLQHLPNSDIKQFLTQLNKFKYCLITNDVNPTTFTSNNRDAPYGHYRPIDLTAPPFSIKAIKVLMYTIDYGNHQDVKQVLLIKNV
jgi:Methyltransferase domain